MSAPARAGAPASAVTRRQRFLLPGHLFATAEPTEVTTILGSCVAVCLWDEVSRVGGMNHFVLPFETAGAVATARCGGVAMARLLSEVEALGGQRRRLQAGVYGGACMFAHLASPRHLGAQNAEIATGFLARHGIPVIDLAVGGNRGRKVRFTTDEGVACSTSI